MKVPFAYRKGDNGSMPILTKRWCDPKGTKDGRRVLVCRYRPRGVRKEDETWDEWIQDLGPSRLLHGDIYGKNGPPIAWAEFRRRYLAEMKEQRERIEGLAALASKGRTFTLLCSSACTDESRCHRTLLKGLIEKAMSRFEKR
jgi:uncharacterized protein YeaO (DUF488 family)